MRALGYVTAEVDVEVQDVLDQMSDQELLEELERRNGLTANPSAERVAEAWNVGNKQEFERLAKELVGNLSNKILL
jgi:hypothetical protein